MSTSLDRGERLPRIDVRIRMSALWAATMFLFAYVDLFSLYRADMRQALDEGRVAAFDVGQPFLLGVTLYVMVPSLMIYLTLVMPRRVNRVVTIVVAAVYAVTIAGSAIGEWGYFVLGSAVEVVLLAIVIHHAWTWRAPVSTDQR
jgi:hypothetical protein